MYGGETAVGGTVEGEHQFQSITGIIKDQLHAGGQDGCIIRNALSRSQESSVQRGPDVQNNLISDALRAASQTESVATNSRWVVAENLYGHVVGDAVPVGERHVGGSKGVVVSRL